MGWTIIGPGVGGGAVTVQTSFGSVAERDVYFSIAGNFVMLTEGLPVMVNEVTATTTFVWMGGDAPTSYDSDLFVESALNSGPSTLYLGIDGTNMTSASQGVNFTDAYGNTVLGQGIFFNDKGSFSPATTIFSKTIVFPAAGVFDTQLPSPNGFLFNTPLFPSYTRGWFIRPATAGTLSIKAYAGVDNTAPIVVDIRVEITALDIGNIVEIPSPNGLLAFPGTSQFLEFIGVDLFGGLQTDGQFTGQTTAYLDATVHVLNFSRLMFLSDKDNYMLFNNEYKGVAPKTNGLVVNYLLTATADSFFLAEMFPGVDGFFNPFVNTIGSATFSPGDLVLIIFGIPLFDPDQNDGLYEVLSHVGNKLEIKGVGITGAVEPFTKTQFVPLISGGSITKVNVSVMRANVEGEWEVGKGSSTPIKYKPADSSTARVATILELDLTFDGTEQQIVFDSTQSIATKFTVNPSGTITVGDDGLFHGVIDLHVDKTGGLGAVLNISVWFEVKPIATGVWVLNPGGMMSNPVFTVDGARSAALTADAQLLKGDEVRVMIKSNSGAGKLTSLTQTVALGDITSYAANLSIFKAGAAI